MANLPFVNITAWASDQVANWLRGLDEVILPYVQSFLSAKVTGKQLLFLNHGDLCKLGVVKLGHRELILEAVEMLHTLGTFQECHHSEWRRGQVRSLPHMEQLSQMLVGLSIEMSATMLAGVQVILLDPVRVTADNQLPGILIQNEITFIAEYLSVGAMLEMHNVTALQLTCKACSLRNEIIAQLPAMLQGSAVSTEAGHSMVPLSILSAVSDVIGSIKQIVSWLDRSPFDTSDEYIAKRDTLIAHGLELLDVTQTPDPLACEKEIMEKCRLIVKFGEKLVQESHDSLMIQPVSLEITTIRKKPEDDLGMHIQSLYNGTHIIGAIKEQSPADLCGKVEEGDEVIQVNYQTVLQKLVTALKDNKKEVTLTLKKRPHHVNPFGPHMRRKKVQKNVKQSTFPKDFGRKSREEKTERAPLKDFINSMLAPYNKESSQEPDSDNENEVFQNTLSAPSSLPLPLEPAKQRRATVSGGSPPAGKRNSLEIINLPSTGRPKSYTISSPSNEVRSLTGSPASDLMSARFLEEFGGEKSPAKESTDTLSLDSIVGNIQTVFASPGSQDTPTDDVYDSVTIDVTSTAATAATTTTTTTLTLTPPNTTLCSEIIAPPAMKQLTSESNIQLQIPSPETQLRKRNSSDVMINMGVENNLAAQLLSVKRIDSCRRAEMYEQVSAFRSER
ncbi:hypothetical protein LSH36_537g02074 [Paralvinella palmiformis]|uniref:Uncharacterized protein n=1 Tax=Paralvinella palmiformis TaxID=53620 RepID=A0AAD9MXV7_9ANNE|nr:hypothetical protein LSH36_537g02074 [Paralvinella palmiformis]